MVSQTDLLMILKGRTTTKRVGEEKGVERKVVIPNCRKERIRNIDSSPINDWHLRKATTTFGVCLKTEIDTPPSSGVVPDAAGPPLRFWEQWLGTTEPLDNVVHSSVS